MTLSEADAAHDFTVSLRISLLGLQVEILAYETLLLEGLASCFESTLRQGAFLPHGEADLLVMLEMQDTPVSRDDDVIRVSTRPTGVLATATLTVPDSSRSLACDLTSWAVANTRAYYVFHAGSVARDGKGILLPGRSRSGKTTLTAGLVKRGFRFLSDEIGIFERSSGQMVGYPRALFVRKDILCLLGLNESVGAWSDDSCARIVSVTDLGGIRASRGAEPAIIVAPRFRPDAATRLERLTPGSAVEVLVDAFCCLSRFKETGLDLLIDLARRVPCYLLPFSDLDSALDAIEDAFDRALKRAL